MLPYFPPLVLTKSGSEGAKFKIYLSRYGAPSRKYDLFNCLSCYQNEPISQALYSEFL